MKIDMVALANESYHAKPWALVRCSDNTPSKRMVFRLAFLMDRVVSKKGDMTAYTGIFLGYMTEDRRRLKRIKLHLIQHQWKIKPTGKDVQDVFRAMPGTVKKTLMIARRPLVTEE